tara:strand:+ start:398 stop:700 length:303 start_codon:yes stop_codon:yes gene_type:complete
MTTIHEASSVPHYIDTFIKSNLQKLLEIHNEGLQENNNEGCLVLLCEKNENKMDVSFYNKELIGTLVDNDTWVNLKESSNGRNIFIVKDIDINSIFIIYL